MASSPTFIATVPNGSAETAERVRALLSATCKEVSVQQVRGSYELRYTKPTCRACLRSESTVLRKALKRAAWEGLPRQFKGDWLQLQPSEAETTASGEVSAAESAASSAEPPDPAAQREDPSLEAVDSDASAAPFVPTPPTQEARPAETAEALPADLAGESDDQQPQADQVVFVEDFRADLARLLKKEPEQLGRIRRVEGTPPKYSLVDTVVALTGQQSGNANRSLAQVLHIDPGLVDLVDHVNLVDSLGRRNISPVADIQTVLRVVVQLQCRGLGPLKRQICEVFSRFMGESPDLLPAALAAIDQQPEAEQVVFVEDFRADLAHLLKKEPEQLGRIRKVEGSPPKYSLVDVIVSITGQAAADAAKLLRRVTEGDRDVRELIPYIPLLDSTGLRRQRTPVADIQTVLRVIVQLPCRGLGPLKREICEVFSRFSPSAVLCWGVASLICSINGTHCLIVCILRIQLDTASPRRRASVEVLQDASPLTAPALPLIGDDVFCRAAGAGALLQEIGQRIHGALLLLALSLCAHPGHVAARLHFHSTLSEVELLCDCCAGVIQALGDRLDAVAAFQEHVRISVA